MTEWKKANEWERKWHPLLPSIDVALSAFKEWIQLE